MIDNALRPNPDDICLDDLPDLFGLINQRGMTRQGQFCGGLAADLLGRCYVTPNGIKEIKPGDLQTIWSHDADFRGPESFFNVLCEFIPEIAREKYDLDVGRHEIPMKRVTIQTEPKLTIEAFERMDFLDYNTARTYYLNPPFLSREERAQLSRECSCYPYEVLQGVPCIEKPFGENGPDVNTLDPAALLVAKAGVIGSFTAFGKVEKYKRHMRVLALAVEPWFESASGRYKDGEFDRNPAIMANRLQFEIGLNRSNFSGIGYEYLPHLRKICRHYAVGTDKVFYTPEDIHQAA